MGSVEAMAAAAAAGRASATPRTHRPSVRLSQGRALVIGLAMLLAWLGWRLADHLAYDYPWQRLYEQTHLAQVRAAAPQALVLGGSNALYGLSAGELSRATGLRWYNASLFGEGHSWHGYLGFIDALAARIDASQVRRVVYSSAYPLMAGELARRESAGTDLYGQAPLTIKPPRSLVKHLRHADEPDAGRTPREGPPPDAHGDLAFERFACVPGRGEDLPLRDESPDVVAAHVARVLTDLHARFPQAQITIVVPSAWAGTRSGPRTASATLDDAAMMARIDRRLGTGSHVPAWRYVTQPALASADQICDLRIHPNAAGRAARTAHLIGRM